MTQRQPEDQEAKKNLHEEVPADPEQLVGKVRDRYARIAQGAEPGCCAPETSCATAEEQLATKLGYDKAQLKALPDAANLGLGCGAPINLLELKPGEVVLDLGSGGGLDVFLAAPLVGPGGKVIGVDMTSEMIERARESAARAGFTQVEFRQGRLEELPVEDASVDAVTSNCVINLVPDKSKVFREIARVLRPGGRLVISDIILDDRLPELLERDLLAYVGCVSGAMQRDRYFETVAASGLTDIRVLKDVDFLATAGELLPDEARELLEQTAMRIEDLKGVVRSVTFRAGKP